MRDVSGVSMRATNLCNLTINYRIFNDVQYSS